MEPYAVNHFQSSSYSVPEIRLAYEQGLWRRLEEERIVRITNQERKDENMSASSYQLTPGNYDEVRVDRTNSTYISVFLGGRRIHVDMLNGKVKFSCSKEGGSIAEGNLFKRFLELADLKDLYEIVRKEKNYFIVNKRDKRMKIIPHYTGNESNPEGWAEFMVPARSLIKIMANHFQGTNITIAGLIRTRQDQMSGNVDEFGVRREVSIISEKENSRQPIPF